MSAVESIVDELLKEGLDDWLPVDRVISLSREVASRLGVDFKGIAIQVIHDLIMQNLMVAGEIGDSGFEEWRGTASEIVDRIVNECESLNWRPYGGVCWFANTEKGRARVG